MAFPSNTSNRYFIVPSDATCFLNILYSTTFYLKINENGIYFPSKPFAIFFQGVKLLLFSHIKNVYNENIAFLRDFIIDESYKHKQLWKLLRFSEYPSVATLTAFSGYLNSVQWLP